MPIIYDFDKMIKQLRSYIKTNDCLPPQRTSTDEKIHKLANWCALMRKNQDTLTDTQKNALTKLKHWYWKKETAQEKFVENYNKLKEFVEENQTFPNIKSKDHDEAALGVWCAKKKGQKDKLADDKIELFEEIDGWEWAKKQNKVVKKKGDYSDIIKWIKDNKRSPMNTTEDETENKYARVCRRIRSMKKDGTLPDSTIKEFDMLIKKYGWYWDKTQAEHYKSIEISVQEIIMFYKKYKRLPKQNKNDDNKDEDKLGRVCSTLKKYPDRISNEDKKLLTNIGLF